MSKKSAGTAAVPASEDHWQAQSDLHTLTEAHRIRNDPKRHAAVKKHASNQMKVLKSMSAAAPKNPLY